MDYKDLKVRPLNHKNNRLTFSQMDLQSDPPDLLNVQVQSYKDFLQEDVPVSRRKSVGIHVRQHYWSLSSTISRNRHII